VSYTGDLGYEIYVRAEEQQALYHILAKAGAEYGLKPFGMRAMMSLRLEKSFGSWGREFRPDYGPAETGMDRFLMYKKPANYIGREAADKEKAEGPSRRLCTFVVDAEDADVWGDEPIWQGDDVIGFVTSGGYAHFTQKSVAYGFVPAELAADGLEVEIEILGSKRKATLFTKPLFDANSERMLG